MTENLYPEVKTDRTINGFKKKVGNENSTGKLSEKKIMLKKYLISLYCCYSRSNNPSAKNAQAL